MPVDVRVVLNWNMNDTDMDLWVTDPLGEKCFYSNNLTKIGGHISRDFTRGYGPEQFMLKKARNGKYKVQLHYYGDGVQKISGGSTVMAEIYTNYGTPSQVRKLIALQMEKDGEKEGILVGEFTF
jgi:Ca-activated chloride channel homolog